MKNSTSLTISILVFLLLSILSIGFAQAGDTYVHFIDSQAPASVDPSCKLKSVTPFNTVIMVNNQRITGYNVYKYGCSNGSTIRSQSRNNQYGHYVGCHFLVSNWSNWLGQWSHRVRVAGGGKACTANSMGGNNWSAAVLIL